MEPKSKESGPVGNEKESPISTSKSTKPTKTSTTASSTNSTHHKAEVNNYLKPFVNIHSQSLKSKNNNDLNQQNNQKPTMNRRRSIDKASSHLQKSIVSPCPRCRNQQFRCASISSKFSSRPIFTDNTTRTISNKPHQQWYPKKKNTTQNKKELANVVESKESLIDHKVTEGDNISDYRQVKDQISDNNENADHSEANTSDESNSCCDIYVVSEETKVINNNVDEEKAEESSCSSQLNEEDQGQDSEQNKDIESREIKLVDEEVKEEESVEETKKKREENKEKYKEEKELKEEEKEKVNNIGMKKDEEGSASSKEEEIETEEEGKRAVKLRHQSRQGSKKESPDYNYVIEETASRLLEKRKNKVRALVGAFETVIDYEFNSSVSNNLNCIIQV